MKKFLVVLTLVLVAGFAFAAVSGTIEARYTFDFTNAKTLKYDVYGSSSKVSFTVSTEQAKVDGSNKPYATVTVDVALTAKLDETKSHSLKEFDYYIASWGELDQFDLGVKLSDFRIVGENWEIDFLKAIAAGDYAKSAWEVDTTEDEKALDAKWSFGKTKGITVTYDGYKVGVRATRNADLLTNVDLRTESKEFTFAEGVTGQAAVAMGLTKDGDEDAKFAFGASVKAAYATDDVTLNGAVDVQYVDKFDADVAVKVAVKPVTVDAYYATQVKTTSKRYFFGSVDDILSVRAAVALDPVTVTVYGENLINNDRILAVKEVGKFGALSEDAQFGIMPSLGREADVEDFKMGLWFANAGVGYDVMENLNVNAHVGYERLYVKAGDEKGHISGLAIQAGAVYKLDVATITADAYVGKMFVKTGDESNNSDLYFACKISAESDKLVENAVLNATLNIDKEGVIGLYKSTRAVDDYTGDKSEGEYVPYALGTPNMSFTVSCKVAF